ncbi:hypothetical protein [Paenibacillus agilis]|uniref:DUF1599 domain-containing protein n=1 Tax=Paenibacillus agilis TaxID=3020863 RepID=A0A559IXA3_9BACL|nr:hypothetical protein [Paenibacillus agilis]TVX92265.1 hypothetical protein FPZ44_03820 [Paenibacillus agilis]
MAWETFLAEATDVFVAKDTDYESRFMRALIHYNSKRGYEAARTIWAWEVEKKLDRCRTWVKRGDLQVKGEGVHDSVIDAFNYTVQWILYMNSSRRKENPIDQLNEANFYSLAAGYQVDDWVNFWANNGLLDLTDQVDKSVALLIANVMTIGSSETLQRRS